ncbi:BON domain-containing protein [Sulfuricella sp.]|uniref:BON domain-containing protein n=1 Tax=Sulfuricella sp. TaxID=2099377 RepID=UPI002C835A27|nr:BON domain-containing protein [Sulfuricella sp.]HUX63371.1 BON domain-containing protein [Sulfuricella sp.]
MNTLERFKLVVVSMAIAAGLVACDKPKPAETAGQKIDQAAEKAGEKMEQAAEKLGAQSEKAGEVFDDAAITAKVKAAILAEEGLKVLQINVDTMKGVVTLSGSVDTQQNSDKAKEIAGAVAGVKEVENKLVVKSTG